MKNRSILIIGGLAILLIGIAIFYAAGYLVKQESVNDQLLTYTNTSYGYQFKYPSDYLINEYTAERVDLGRQNTAGGFDTALSFEVIESSNEAAYDNFEEYLIARTRTLCDADGPDESLSCSRDVASEPITTASGLQGEKLMLELLYENRATNQTATSTFGPIYAFDVSSHEANAEYAALIIYTPLSVTAPSTLADSILSTLRITRVNER